MLRALTAAAALALACRNEPPRAQVRPERADAAAPRTRVEVDARAVDPREVTSMAPAPTTPLSPPAPTTPPPDASVDGRDPALEDDPYADGGGELGDNRRMLSVPLPEVPAEMAREVARYRALVVRTMHCWSISGRTSHTPDPACARWFAELGRGGLPAVHAIGRFAYDEVRHRLPRRERAATMGPAMTGPDLDNVAERITAGGTVLSTADGLAPTLGGIDAKEVVPYVLMAMQRPLQRGYGDWGLGREVATWMSQLPRVTGVDLTPLPEWQLLTLDDGALMRFLADAHDTWCGWYRAHQHETLDAWRAQGIARARAALTGRAVAPRVAAIVRLAAPAADPADREAARASLTALLAERRLSNEGRRAMRRFADEHGWSLAPDAGAARP